MLKGTLDDFSLADIFRLMSIARRTGKLEVVRSAGLGKVFVREGEVYYAESSLVREPLGQKLIRSGALTEGALMKALDENAASGKRVGEVLVDSGAISYEQLQRALQQQIEDAVFDLLRWDLGEFTWEPGVIAEVEVNIAVSVENLIIEASRRLDELEVIGRKIPSIESVLKMAQTPPEGAAEINITPEEWRMLVLVDGLRTVHDIALEVGVDDLTALRSLYGLVSAGLAEVKEGRDSIDAVGRPHEEVRGFSRSEESLEEATPQVVTEPEFVPEPSSEPEAAEIGEPEPEPETESEADIEAQPEAEADAEAQPETEADSESETEMPDAFVEPEPEPDLPEAEPDPEPEPEMVSDPEPTAEAEDSGLEIDPDSALRALDSLQADPLEDVAGDPLFEEADASASVEEFDSPAPDELVSQAPEEPIPGGDPFLGELLAAGLDTSTDEEEAPSEEPSIPDMPEAPAAEEPTPPPAPGEPEESPSVDRAAVVRELAGLFDDDRPRTTRAQTESRSKKGDDEETEGADQRHRVEDDDQLNKGLIGRLIDGVKGL